MGFGEVVYCISIGVANELSVAGNLVRIGFSRRLEVGRNDGVVDFHGCAELWRDGRGCDVSLRCLGGMIRGDDNIAPGKMRCLIASLPKTYSSAPFLRSGGTIAKNLSTTQATTAAEEARVDRRISLYDGYHRNRQGCSSQS